MDFLATWVHTFTLYGPVAFYERDLLRLLLKILETQLGLKESRTTIAKNSYLQKRCHTYNKARLGDFNEGSRWDRVQHEWT